MGVLEIYNRQNPILDDRRIATGVLYERMKHITGLSFGNMWTFTLGFQHTARQQENADRLCGKVEGEAS